MKRPQLGPHVPSSSYKEDLPQPGCFNHFFLPLTPLGYLPVLYMCLLYSTGLQGIFGEDITACIALQPTITACEQQPAKGLGP